MAACIPAPDDVATYAGTAAFPRLPSEVETLSTVTGFVPSHIFGCQEAGGGRILDSVDNVALAEKLLGGSSMQFGVATSLEGGARRAIRFTEGSSEGLIADNNQLMSPFGGSVGWAVVYKAPNDLANRCIAGYGQALTSAEPENTAGIMSYFNSSGWVNTAFSDGLVGAGTSLINADLCDDTWRIFGSFYNSVSGNNILSNGTGQHTRSLAPLTFTDMRQYFSVGASLFASQGMDVAGIYLFEGSSCELTGVGDYITALSAIQTNFLGTI